MTSPTSDDERATIRQERQRNADDMGFPTTFQFQPAAVPRSPEERAREADYVARNIARTVNGDGNLANLIAQAIREAVLEERDECVRIAAMGGHKNLGPCYAPGGACHAAIMETISRRPPP